MLPKLLLPALALLAACSTIPPLNVNDALDPAGKPQVNYRRSLELKVNGQKGVGILVVPRSTRYQIEARAHFDMDFLLLETCGRVKPFEKEDDHFSYTYDPAPGIEDNRPCALRLTGIEKGKNRRGLGMILFQDPAYSLPATLNCDGAIQAASSGVSGCQSGVGVFVRVTLPAPVVLDAGEAGHECARPLPVPDQANTYEFKMPRGDCRIRFLEKTGGRMHRLSVYGFDEILPEASL